MNKYKSQTAIALALSVMMMADGVSAQTPGNGGTTGRGGSDGMNYAPLAFQPAASIDPEMFGDGLGDHIASQLLNMSGYRIANLGNPTELTDAVNVAYLNAAIVAGGDNLGNHIASQTLVMSNYEINGLGDPSTETSAVNLRTMNTAIANAVVPADNLGNHIATMNLDMNSFRVVDVADPFGQADAVNLRSMMDAIAANGDNLGNHIANRNLMMGSNRIEGVAAPVEGTDAVNRQYVDGLVSALPEPVTYSAGAGISISGSVISFDAGWGDARYALRSRQVIAGAGLSGGGDLSTNRTFSFDTGWGDARYALRDRAFTAGDGLQGGGNLHSNRSFAVDNTVVRTAGNQTIAGNKTFTGIINFSGQRIHNVGDPVNDSDAANRRFVLNQISAIPAPMNYYGGVGITVTDGEISFSTSWGDGRYALRSRTLTAGDGLLGGGNLQANRAFAVDGTVVRTAGNQTIGDNKTFTGNVHFSNRIVTGIASPVNGSDAANRDFVMAQIGSMPTPIFYVGGTGITVTGNVVSFSTVWGDARYAQVSRTITAGDGLAGGGSLVANRSIAVDGTVVRTSGDQSIAGAKTFSGLISFSNRVVTGVADPVSDTDVANRRFVMNQIGALPTPAIYTAGTGITLASGAFSFDTTWGDARYALRSRTMNAGDGLLGGGNLTANRTFAVDGTVVRTSGNQTIDGNKTFIGLVNFADQIVSGIGDPVDGTDAVNLDFLETRLSTIPTATYTAGTGLALTGSAFSFSTTWGDARYAMRSRTLTAGDGLNGGGNLQSNRTFSVDNTVVRTSGNQSVSGEKTFTAGIFLNGQRARNMGDPADDFDGVNLRTLDAAIAAVTPGGTGMPVGVGDGLQMMANIISVNNTVVRTSGNQIIAGLKTFRQSSGSRFERAATQDAIVLLGRSGGTGSYQVSITPTTLSANRTLTLANGNTVLVSGTMVQTTRTITAGTGLSGGGDLQANRTLAFDATWGDARYAMRSRTLTAGDGLSGGGTLQSNRSFSVDNTVVRTAGNQSIAGAKTFTGAVNFSGQVVTGIADPVNGTDAANRQFVLSQIAGLPVPTAYSAGTGLALSGSVFSFSTTWGDARYALRSRTLAAGDGLTGGGNLQANRTFAVDGTVVRTSGNQSIGGAKTFTSQVNFNNLVVAGVASPINATDAANRAFVLDQVASVPTPVAGTGITVSGSTISFNTTWGDARYALASRSMIAGTGITGGGTLQANRTFNFDTSWGDGRYALRSRTITAGTGLSGGGNLQANRTVSFDTTWGDARYTNYRTDFNSASSYDDVLESNIARAYTFGHSSGSRPSDAPIAAQASGLHIANSWGRAQIVMPNTTTNRLFFRTGSLTGWSEVWHSGNFDPSGLVGDSRSIFAGTGLTGGGQLNADRTINFDTTWGDARYALRSRTITAGTGLTGGGSLQANRTINFDTSWGDGHYALRARILTAGDGLSGGGNLQSDRAFAVDGTVVRTSGTQIIAGLKTFRQSSGSRFERAATQDAVLLQGRAGGTSSYQVTITPTTLTGNRTLTLANGNTVLVSGTMVQTTRTITAGTGLSGGGDLQANRTINFDTSWGDGRYALASRSMIAGTGITGGGTLEANRTFNFDTTWGDGRYALRSRVMTAGDGLSGGGNLQSNRTFSVDSSVVRTSGNQTIAGTKTFTGGVTNFQSADGVIRIAPTGWRTSTRAQVLIQSLTNNPAEIDLANTNSGNLYGWQISSRAGTSPDLIFYANNSNSYSNRMALDFDGHMTLSSGLTLGSQATSASHAVRADRTISASNGLTGGGSLQANRTFGLTGQALALHNLSTSGLIARTASGVVQGRTLLGGTGISVTTGNAIAGNPSIAVDSSVIRNTGSQVIQGLKTFRQTSGTRFERAATQDAIRILPRGGGTDSYQVTITTATLQGNRTLTLADGNTTLMPGTMVSTTANQTIGGLKTFSSNLTVSGNLYANLYLHNSDRTLKDDIEVLEGASALRDLRRVEPVSYNWLDTGAHSMGVIAQDLQNVYPHMVFEHPESGTLTVEYTQLIAPMIAAIQELDDGLVSSRAENEDLRRENQELQLIIGSFEERLQAMEALLR